MISSFNIENVRFENLGAIRPLFCDGDSTYAGRGFTLYKLSGDDENKEYITRWKAPIHELVLSANRFSARITRSGIHGLLVANSDVLLAIVRGKLLYSGEDRSDFVPVFTISDGSRPLNLCEIPEYGFYFGEYFSNGSRREVHIYGSEDGLDWCSIYCFPAGSIRHIHGIYYDRYRGGAWVLTGDEDYECGLWFSGDGFRTLNKIVAGDQKSRAVSIIPMESGVVVPMDSPLMRNQIQLLDVERGLLHPVHEVSGSVFDAVIVNDVLLVSTVVEPSEVNTDQCVFLYASLDGQSWCCVGQFSRDLPQAFDRYFQYPRLVLTPACGQPEWAYGYAVGLKGIDGNGLRWCLSDIRDRLSLL